MEQFTYSLIIIFLGVIFIPSIARRIRLPVIVVELLFGILIGASFLKLVPHHPLFEFFSSFGLSYILFLAGTEVSTESIHGSVKRNVLLAFVSVFLPFAAGVWLGPRLGIHPFLLGSIFSTSSLGLIIPLKKERNINLEVLNAILPSLVLAEIASIILLGFSLSYLEGSVRAEFAYSLLAVLLLFTIPVSLSRMRMRHKAITLFSRLLPFDVGIRVAFALIFILGAVSEFFGFHTLIGSFIAGMIVATVTPDASSLEERLESFGYGFFIPLFFVLVGVKMDVIPVFSDWSNIAPLIILVVAGIASNVIGVAFVSRVMAGYTTKESFAIGFLHASLLSLTIAAAEIGERNGFISATHYSQLILLAAFSALIAPTIGKHLLKRIDRVAH